MSSPDSGSSWGDMVLGCISSLSQKYGKYCTNRARIEERIPIGVISDVL